MEKEFNKDKGNLVLITKLYLAWKEDYFIGEDSTWSLYKLYLIILTFFIVYWICILYDVVLDN